MLATVGMISALSRKSGLSTPTISNWFFASRPPFPKPFSVMLVPTTAGSALKTRRQNP
jgi:hypothetical protein